MGAPAKNKNYRRELTIQALNELYVTKKGLVESYLPKHINQDRMLRLIYSAFTSTRGLSSCSALSIVNSIMHAAQVGLEFNTLQGHGWIIPRWNSRAGVMEASFQPGYRGLIDLAYRSNLVTAVASGVVKARDDFEFDDGTQPTITHHWDLTKDRGDWVGAWARVDVKDGRSIIEVMQRSAIELIRDTYAPRKKSGEMVGPWITHPDAMIRKTAAKRPLKFAPASTELANAIGLDDVLESAEPIPTLVNVEDFQGTDVSKEDLLDATEPIQITGSKAAEDEVLQDKLEQTGMPKKQAWAETIFKRLGKKQQAALKAYAAVDGKGTAIDLLAGCDHPEAAQQLVDTATEVMNATK